MATLVEATMGEPASEEDIRAVKEHIDRFAASAIDRLTSERRPQYGHECFNVSYAYDHSMTLDLNSYKPEDTATTTDTTETADAAPAETADAAPAETAEFNLGDLDARALRRICADARIILADCEEKPSSANIRTGQVFLAITRFSIICCFAWSFETIRVNTEADLYLSMIFLLFILFLTAMFTEEWIQHQESLERRERRSYYIRLIKAALGS